MIIRNTNLIVENLYYLLWLKDSGLKEASFNVKIPDTLIVQAGKVMNWFFSSKNGEGVLMKKDINLKNTTIFESFTRHESKSGIVALFIEKVINDQDQDKSKKTFLKSRNNNYDDHKVKFDIPKNEGQIIIRYLTKEKLKELLFTEMPESKTGILQKYIDPYGENEAVIQAVWSPQLCVFSKRVNYRHLFDQRYDSYERLTTFDGAEMYSRTVPLRGKIISQEMRRFCENIVQRIAHVSFQKIMIQRMVVYFKADKNNNLYFLYCSSLRLHGETIDPDILDEMQYKIQNTPLVIDTNYEKPEEVKLIQTTNTMRPISLENNLKCFYCQKKIQPQDLVAVTYEFIINNFEENPNAKYSKVSNIAVLEVPKEQNFILEKEEYHYIKDKSSEIPELIAKLYPKLTVENYHKFRQNKKFLNQKIRLCSYCYLDFSRYIKMSGAPLKGVQDFTFMKKGLAKKGSLFTREMKAIVAAKNVEMTEQKGSEFVKYQNREVYKRMLDNLLEEMERKERESKKAVDHNIVPKKVQQQQQQKEQDDEKDVILENYTETSKRESILQANRPLLKRPQSCTNFNQLIKLKEIQKQIQLFDNKMENQQINSNYQSDLSLSKQKSKKSNQSLRLKNREYIDKEYLDENDYDSSLRKSQNTKQNENKFIDPEKTPQQTQIEHQYKLNANFISAKKAQLSLNRINSSSSKDREQQIGYRPQSTTAIKSKTYQNSTKDSYPQSANVYTQQQNISSPNLQEKSIFNNSPYRPSIKKINSFTIAKPQRIQTAQTSRNKKFNSNINIGNFGSFSTLKSPISTKISTQTNLQSNKHQSMLTNIPSKGTLSHLIRPHSHQIFSNPSTLPHPQDDYRIKTEQSAQKSSFSFQDRFIKANSHSRGFSRVSDNNPIVEQMYDDQDINNDGVVEFNYENLDFDFEGVNDDYCNQRD